MKPKVSFHWDGDAERWLGPESKRGDHYRVLPAQDTEETLRLAAKAANAGGLGYPPTPPPPAPASALAGLKKWPANLEELPPEKLSQPYRAQPLAGLSDEQLLAYMGASKSALDYVADRMKQATSLPSFWTMDPIWWCGYIVGRIGPTGS